MGKKVFKENGRTYVTKEKKPIYKRIWFWLIAILAIVFILGSLNDTESNNSEKDNKATEEVKVSNKSATKESSTPDLIGAKLSAPGNIGDSVAFDLNDYSGETIGIKINAIYSSINGSTIQEYLQNENQFNPVADEGWQWVVADTDIAYLAADVDDEEASQTIFLDPKVIVDRQIQQKQSLVVSDDMDTHLELYNKSSEKRFIPLLIPSDLSTKKTVVRFSGFLGEDYRYIQISSNDITEFNG